MKDLKTVELYHGTSTDSVASILKNGIQEGSSFASDPAFALNWALLRFPKDKIAIVVAKLPSSSLGDLVTIGIRTGKITCSQYTVKKGQTIPPDLLALGNLSEFEADLKYAVENSPTHVTKTTL